MEADAEDWLWRGRGGVTDEHPPQDNIGSGPRTYEQKGFSTSKITCIGGRRVYRRMNSPQDTRDRESDDDSFEVLDITQYARRHHWWSRIFGNNSGPITEKYSVATQIVIGGVSGWCAGFLFQKVGKLAATAVGGGFLLLQIASHSGYVQIDWKRVEKDVTRAKRKIRKQANKAAPEINNLIEESTEFVKQNIVVSSGFVGGFLLGLAS
ncbi:FUN14 domain-containing protein 1 [Pleurodeles waltl]